MCRRQEEVKIQKKKNQENVAASAATNEAIVCFATR
jgi:hypothetical protein